MDHLDLFQYTDTAAAGDGLYLGPRVLGAVDLVVVIAITADI